MSDTRGMDYLRPFLPGLESVLEDEDVSEIMINGPANVWVERLGEIRPHPAPGLDAAALERAIQIARPLGLDPASSPILDARWMTVPAWRSVCPRPRLMLPSPSGASASGAIRPRISCASAHCPKKCWTRRAPRCSGGGISSCRAGPARVRPPCSMPSSSCSPPMTALFPSRTPWNSGSTGKTVSASRRGALTAIR